MKYSLEQAYKQARYVVYYQQREEIITVGKHCLWLDNLMKAKNIHQAAFMTAYNPQSHILNDQTNEFNHHKLEKIINAKGFSYLTGYSSDQKGEWPQEQSFLIFNLQQKEAQQLAVSFKQLAYLWIEYAIPVRLINT